jgi:2-polyprenyl-6-methoxyphenol hydroxylase-like FAD-dependent oxidoreductase
MGTIAIAGAGVGGLALAAVLQAQGRDVVVFERHPEFRASGTAISIWPNALAALDTVGLGDAVRSSGRQLTSVELRKLSGRPALTISSRAFRAALGEGLVCAHREELVAALGESLRPGTIRFGKRVVGYGETDDRVTVRLAEGETVDVGALVGADGIRSAVAGQLCGSPRFSYSGPE